MSIKQVYDWYAKEGYLSASRIDNLTLYKYTTRTVLEANWNYHTMSARGLVLDDNGKVIARPWPKFFNINERPECNVNVLPADELPELAEKLDGTCIVAFYDHERGFWRACTLGSWESEQAKYATEWLRVQGPELWGKWDRSLTHLFELIGPKNRIVVDYPETKLILTGLVNTESTEDYSYKAVREYGRTIGNVDTVHYEDRPISDVRLDDPDIVNKEGYVARYSNGFRVKLKYTQYMLLHRLLTGLSSKNIWEALSAGKEMEMQGLVPDEFLDWFNREKCDLLLKYDTIEKSARLVWMNRPIGPNVTRKDVAAYFEKQKWGLKPLAGVLFRMYDNQSYEDIIWKMVKPTKHETFQIQKATR